MKSVSVSKGKIATRKIAVIGLLSAVSVVMGLTGFGFVPLPWAKATIMHLPVIIGAIIEGPIVGAFIGLMFGLFSIYSAITAPLPTSFVFLDPLVSVLPRILIGIVAYYSYKGLMALTNHERDGVVISTIGAAGLATLTNTGGVLLMIYLRYGAAFAEAIGKDPATAGKVLATIGFMNGTAEILAACGITVIIIKSLKVLKR